MQSFQDFIGKTIIAVDDSCVNSVAFTFSDGTTCQVIAECGTSAFDIPFFDFSASNKGE